MAPSSDRASARIAFAAFLSVPAATAPESWAGRSDPRVLAAAGPAGPRVVVALEAAVQLYPVAVAAGLRPRRSRPDLLRRLPVARWDWVLAVHWRPRERLACCVALTALSVR